ncbi:MAG TPA: type VI secretion system baseplate subunit TssG [Verrucomicrobiae bacterium]|jgi:type VI secretion system protein ImpH
MAGPDRKTPDNLVAELAERPFAFDFFRAVRLLESRRRDLPRVGSSLSPAQDAVRFGQTPSLAFPPSTLESVEPRESDGGAKLFVRFFGLFGPNAPLPPHLTEYAHERTLHHGDRTFTAFLDVFHHRLTSFFYRAWAANQKTVDLDRPDDERFSMFIGSMFGLGGEALRNHDSVPDWAKLHFAGRLACQTRSAEGLESILAEFFGVPAQVQTFVGHWMDLPADSICELGKSQETGSIGANAIVGLSIFDAQLKFRIRLGPMKLADYERLLPNSPAFERLGQWVLNYCGQQFFWDAQLVLEADEVPVTQLGTAGRLGWTTWLKTQPFTRDADDLILVPS